MTTETTQPSVDALRTALDQARLDPRVEAISRSLRLDLTAESLWRRVRGQAELNHRVFGEGESKLEPFPCADKYPGCLRRQYVVDAMAAYAAISRI